MTIIDPASIRRLADMHAVYRMFDEAGRLLYVGISGRAGRFDEHAVKRWFPLVSRITLEWYATHAESALAERRAIATEKPRYNVAGKAGTRKPSVKSVPPVPPGAATLSDVCVVFEEDHARALHWQVIAARLARKFPQRWDGISGDLISAHCRALGVRSVAVRMRKQVLHGCRRADVEEVLARQILKEVG